MNPVHSTTAIREQTLLIQWAAKQEGTGTAHRNLESQTPTAAERAQKPEARQTTEDEG
jgi:hypothetical protein